MTQRIQQKIRIPDLGAFVADAGLIPLSAASDGVHSVGKDGVLSITATADRKVEFIAYHNHTLAYVTSALG
jgi:hypothetical protein